MCLPEQVEGYVALSVKPGGPDLLHNESVGCLIVQKLHVLQLHKFKGPLCEIFQCAPVCFAA